MTIRPLFPLIAWLPLTVLSCSAGSNENKFGGNGATGGSGGSSDGGMIDPDSSAGGTAGTGGTSPWNPDSGAHDSEPLGDGDVCTATSVAAEPYPLDMYVMMDQSGSMSSPAGMLPTSPTKWQAVAAAFQSFMQTTSSTGLSMGIQYFPLPVAPWSSMTVCDPNDAAACPGGMCVTVDTGSFCHASCSVAADCSAASECRAASSTTNFCSNDSCDFGAYATPEVGIAELPGVAPAINTSLSAHGPQTMTPSAPALHGAVEYGKQWATAHPEHTTIVVFATDGMPTVCPAGASDAELINLTKQAAQAGVQATPPVRTFVIGVVTPGDIFANNNLNAIATAGGTYNALILNPNQDLTTQFSQALEAIRGASMQCEFKVPDTGAMLDYGKVNVIYTAVDQQKYPVYYVGDAAHCDPTDGGWYYDIDPAAGKPTKILLCPQSCTFMQKYGGKIDIQMGCKTITPPK